MGATTPEDLERSAEAGARLGNGRVGDPVAECLDLALDTASEAPDDPVLATESEPPETPVLHTSSEGERLEFHTSSSVKEPDDATPDRDPDEPQ